MRGTTAHQEAACAFAAEVMPIIREIQATGTTSFRGIAKALSDRGIKTARGGAWTAVQVSDILRRSHTRRPIGSEISGDESRHAQEG